jgi:4-amino-4-deoxy-L-arabinose transferase-like glycosyltransferase
MRNLVVVLVVGAVLRLALVLWFHGRPLEVHDERDYDQLATTLVETARYAAPSGELTSLRPPLYPALVAGVYLVAGVENHTAVRLVQVLISLATVVLVYRLATRLYDPRIGLWAATVTCFYPSLLASCCFLLTETLFAFWIVLFALSVLEFLETRSVRSILAAGVVLGLAALTRSVLWLFPPFLFLFLVVAQRDVRLVRRLAMAAVPVVAFALTIAPWAIRNTLLQRTFVAIDVMGGRNFMMGNYLYTPLHRAWDAISMEGERSWHAVLAADTPEYAAATQGQRDKLALRRGLKFAWEHPTLTLQRSVMKFLAFWQLERELVAGASRGYWGVDSPAVTLALAGIIFAGYALVLLGGILGFMTVPPMEMRFHWFLLMLVGFVCGIHTAVFGHSRYHLPLMPLIGVYCAASVVQFRSIWQKADSMAFRLAAAVCCLFCAAWIWEVLAVEMFRVRQLIL